MTVARTGRSRLFEWEDPATLTEALQRHGGLSMLRAIADGTLPPAPMTQLLGLKLVEVDEGRTVWSAEPAEQHQNEAGLVHGGLAAALLDTAMGTTLVSALPPSARCAGLQLSVNFLRPLTPGSGQVRCEGRVVQLGKRVAVTEAELRTEPGGDLLARATSTFSVLREERELR